MAEAVPTDRNPMRGAFFGCCASAIAPATTSTKATIESPDDFRFLIFDFRLSDKGSSGRVQDLSIILSSLNRKSAIENPKSVAVGTALASGPPHGSVREELPHTALASGSCDDQPLVGVRMQYPCGREPVANQPCHVLPTSATKFLTAPSQNAKPDAAHLVAEPAQTRAVSRYRMIVEPPPNHRSQPRAHFSHHAMHVPFE